MDPRPLLPLPLPRPLLLLLLLAGLLLHGQRCEGVQSSYTIDAVRLDVLPGPTVPSGTAVTLRCAVSVSHDSTRRLSHVFRFIRYDMVVHAVNTTDSEVLYQLDPARAADSGAYECQVEVEKKVRSSIGQKLTVTGLQTPVFHLHTHELYEGQQLVATCAAPGEKGSLVFNFLQQSAGGPVTVLKQAAPAGNWSETRLVLRDPGSREMFCNYSIPMMPQAGSSNSSNKLRVLVKGLFISPVMNVLPSTDVFEGDVVEVVCKVVNPPGAVDVYLTKDRKVLKSGSVGLSQRLTLGTADAGEYVCKAEYDVAQKETYKTIRVKELFSRPQLTLDPRDVFEGDLMTVTCAIDSYSPERLTLEDIQLSIYKDQEPLPGKMSYRAVAQAAQNGNYTCKAQANTQLSPLGKESAVLVVKAKVPVSRPVLSVVGGSMVVGKPFTVHCCSDQGSPPITYTLHGPGRPQQAREVRQPGKPAVFHTPAVLDGADLQHFLCMAQNSPLRPAATSSAHDFQLGTKVIEPVSKPVLTLSPNEAYISEGQDLVLLCSVQKGTLPLNITWFRADRPSPLASRTFRSAGGSHTVPAVHRGHSGGYYCVCSNPAGDAKRSFTVVVGVKMAGWKKGLIAVAAVLLLMATILAVLHKKGLLRRRRRVKELSVKSAGTHPERLSLTKAVETDAVNVTPGVMGRSVWSDHVSGSDTDEQNSVVSPEDPEPQYTEVQTRQPDPSRGPVKKGTDTVYSEVRDSKQGVSEEPADGGSVEYAQLNHDSGRNSGHRNSGHLSGGRLSIQPDIVDDIDELNDTGAAAVCEEPPGPDC